MGEPALDMHSLQAALADALDRADRAERRAAEAEVRAKAAESRALRSDTHTALAEGRARALTDTARRYRTLVAHLPDAFVIVFDTDLRYRVVEGPGLANAGLSREAMEGRTLYELFPADVVTVLEPMYRATLQGHATTEEVMHGERTFVIHNRPLKDDDGTVSGGMVLAQDITRLKEVEAELRKERAALEKSLRQRDVLLQEVYHRVKNNLQVVMSLLSLQARSVTDEAAVHALRSCRERIAAMARVHERLYRSTDLERLEFGKYIDQLVRELSSTYRRDSAVEVVIHTASVFLSLQDSVPCGLILHELVANALEHAWPDGRAGKLEVTLTTDGDTVTLVVADDGVGLPTKPQRREGSLGTLLVESLAGQLGGTLAQDGSPGTRWTLRFPTRQGTP